MPQDLISQFDRKYALPIETYRQVQNITQRNNIPDSIRWEGMIVHVLGDQSYILLGGIDDTKWEPLGGLVNVTVVDNLLSTSSTDALSANQGRVLQTTKLSDAPSDGNTYGRLDGAWAVVGGGAVDSVFGRTGAVVAQTGDYTFAQIGSKPTTIGGYGITDFNSLGDVRWLGIGAKAADSNLLDGLDSTAFQTRNEKGTANGYTPLDSGAKVPIAYLPDSVIGQVQYQGTWAASTNTPTLANPPSAATKGHYYVASDNGTQFGISFQTGDWIISNGTAWEKVDNTDAVTSVFGRIGAVVANAGDYTFAQIGSKPTTLAGYGITDAVPTSRNINAGIHLSGGGNLSLDRTLTLTPAVNQNVVDSQGNPRMYFGADNVTADGLILRASGPNQELTWRDSSNNIRWRVDTNGNSIQSGTATATNFIGNWNGLSGGQFLRSDANDIKTAGYTRYNNGAPIQFGTAPGARMVHSGSGFFWDLYAGNIFIRDDATNRFTFERTTGNFIATGAVTASNLSGTNTGDQTLAGLGGVPTSRTLTAGDGLTGGGSLAANRTFAVDSTVVRTTGTQSIGGAKTFTSNVIGSGTFTGTNFILSSDRRLKKDIRDYSPTPLPIKWKTFDWKSGAKNQIGVIAQEVQEVAPHLVEKTKDGTLSVRMIDLLVAKVAELEARIINLDR